MTVRPGLPDKEASRLTPHRDSPTSAGDPQAAPSLGAHAAGLLGTGVHVPREREDGWAGGTRPREPLRPRELRDRLLPDASLGGFSAPPELRLQAPWSERGAMSHSSLSCRESTARPPRGRRTQTLQLHE